METKVQQKPQNISTQELAKATIEGISDKKGQKITQLNLTHLNEAACDYFIICQGNSTTHAKAIANNVIYHLKKEWGEYPMSFEGMKNAEWILIDYASVVVHVFVKEKRTFYQLEDLWSDAVVTNYDEDGSKLTDE